MKYAILASLALFAALFAVAARADASTELCPAEVAAIAPSAPASADAASTAFTYELHASSKRTIDAATLVADTDHGWYRWSIAAVPMTPADEQVNGPHGKYSHALAQSPSLEVSFPQAVVVHRAWAERANDSACPVPAFAARDITAQERAIDAATVVSPSPAPALAQQTAKAHPIAMPFDSIECAVPFRNAAVTDPRIPEFPDAAKGMFSSPATTEIEITVDPSGALLDASLYASSGFSPLDASSLRAARSSTYSGAISYCQPVKGQYLFSATFTPH